MTNKSVSVIFPNQLFEKIPEDIRNSKIYLIEDSLFFKQYKFCKSKLVFHRQTMMEYSLYLKSKKLEHEYIKHYEERADLKVLFRKFKLSNIKRVFYIDPVDNYLTQKVKNLSTDNGLSLIKLCNENFYIKDIKRHSFFCKKKVYRHSIFYKQQRLDYDILVNGKNPVGGKWSFDSDNRKRYPKDKTPPRINYPNNKHFKKAINQIEKEFKNNYGSLPEEQLYPSNFRDANLWFNQFLEKRFYNFGTYEDAIIKGESFIHHSILSPLLNTGLLSPKEIIDKTIKFAYSNEIPLNSLEGFIRQILGWREFIRGMYEVRGSYMRNKNFWGFTNEMPKSLYDANTGITPVDSSITKLLKSGYNHHIERLMILGNFMLLCEINPNDVYKWFMELYVDSYDWVMVPNVYGMSQFSDGGLFASKPYISSSNYIIKMSDFHKGEWSEIWDSLFWRFMNKHRLILSKNPRIGLIIRNFDKKTNKDKIAIEKRANNYLSTLYN